MFENFLVNHCSPTLAGLKVANMFMYKGEDVYENIEYLNNIFQNYGLKLIILKQNRDKFLIYIYRLSMLKKLLENESIQEFLKEYGYTDFSDIDHALKILASKFVYSDFPHEIGIFLGYPLEDVKMFILHKGKNYKYCGIWKVYYNERKSIELFEIYKKCTHSLASSFLKGQNILSLCVA